MDTTSSEVARYAGESRPHHDDDISVESGVSRMSMNPTDHAARRIVERVIKDDYIKRTK
jgi:hypothetical protein